MASDDKFVLKPCPCCGGHATMEHGAERPDNGWVVCMECGLSTRYFADPAEAAAEWNRRSNETDALAPGNAAAMREALFLFVHDFASFRKDVEHGISHMMQCMDFVKEFIPLMESALSAPARNCDVMSRSMCTTHFSTTYEGNRDGLCDVQTEREKNIHLYYMELIDWLFAPAAERKGEGDGR